MDPQLQASLITFISFRGGQVYLDVQPGYTNPPPFQKNGLVTTTSYLRSPIPRLTGSLSLFGFSPFWCFAKVDAQVVFVLNLIVHLLAFLLSAFGFKAHFFINQHKLLIVQSSQTVQVSHCRGGCFVAKTKVDFGPLFLGGLLEWEPRPEAIQNPSHGGFEAVSIRLIQLESKTHKSICIF